MRCSLCATGSVPTPSGRCVLCGGALESILPVNPYRESLRPAVFRRTPSERLWRRLSWGLRLWPRRLLRWKHSEVVVGASVIGLGGILLEILGQAILLFLPDPKFGPKLSRLELVLLAPIVGIAVLGSLWALFILAQASRGLFREVGRQALRALRLRR